MTMSSRRTAAVLAAATFATAGLATGLAAAPALALGPAPSRVSAVAGDSTVSSGEQFVIRGRLLSEGTPVGGAVVRITSLDGGHWVALSGARVTTNSEGRYRVRVVLSRTGDRLLRAVANPAGDGIRTARRNVEVTVR